LARKLNQVCVKSNAKPGSGTRDLKQNKHQLLHRIASILSTLIYNNILLPKKITKPNYKWKKVAKTLLYEKAAHKMLMKKKP